MQAKHHEKLDLLKLNPSEKIVAVQRQHWTSLILPLGIPLFILVLLVCLSIFLSLQKFFVVSPLLSLFLFHSFLFVVGASLVYETYIFLFWYYQFYIITNKRIVHRRHFTLGGRHIDEVFLDATPIKEIIREASNPLFDLIHLEDVYIYFQRLERPEPFIFRKPEEPRVVENIMERAAVKKLDIE